MHDTLFELTEDHLLEGPRSIPMGFVGTSHVDLDLGLMYFGTPVENFLEEPLDALIERFLGFTPLYSLKETTRSMIDALDRNLPPLEQLHRAIEILSVEEYKDDFAAQLGVILGSIREVAELLFGPLPIDPEFYSLHLDEGGGSPPAFTAKVLASNGCDAYKAVQGALLAFKAPRVGFEMENALKLLQEIDLEQIERNQTFYGYQLYPFLKKDTRADFFERALSERFMDEPLFQKAIALKKWLEEHQQMVPHSHAFSGLYLFYRGFEEVHLYCVVLFLARLIGIGAQLLELHHQKGLEIHPYYFYKKNVGNVCES